MIVKGRQAEAMRRLHNPEIAIPARGRMKAREHCAVEGCRQVHIADRICCDGCWRRVPARYRSLCRKLYKAVKEARHMRDRALWRHLIGKHQRACAALVVKAGQVLAATPVPDIPPGMDIPQIMEKPK